MAHIQVNNQLYGNSDVLKSHTHDALTEVQKVYRKRLPGILCPLTRTQKRPHVLQSAKSRDLSSKKNTQAHFHKQGEAG